MGPDVFALDLGAWKRLAAKMSRKERVAKLREYVTSFKASRGCYVCGEHDPVVLDLHHRDRGQKTLSVSAMVQQTKHIDLIVAEIDKCQVICANDHRRLHNRERSLSHEQLQLTPATTPIVDLDDAWERERVA